MVFKARDMHALNCHEVMIVRAAQCLDDAGKLKDEEARELISELFQNLVDLARKFQSEYDFQAFVSMESQRLNSTGLHTM